MSIEKLEIASTIGKYKLEKPEEVKLINQFKSQIQAAYNSYNEDTEAANKKTQEQLEPLRKQLWAPIFNAYNLFKVIEENQQLLQKCKVALPSSLTSNEKSIIDFIKQLPINVIELLPENDKNILIQIKYLLGSQNRFRSINNILDEIAGQPQIKEKLKELFKSDDEHTFFTFLKSVMAEKDYNAFLNNHGICKMISSSMGQTLLGKSGRDTEQNQAPQYTMRYGSGQPQNF